MDCQECSECLREAVIAFLETGNIVKSIVKMRGTSLMKEVGGTSGFSKPPLCLLG